MYRASMRVGELPVVPSITTSAEQHPQIENIGGRPGG